jgi:deazaflavin-dependent oxidoreductase (nitroreductase family)
MIDQHSQNRQVIEEFRANGGKVGGRFEGAPLLLLTTIGVRSGQRHTTPLRYLPDGDRLIVFAANAGAANFPDWYRNLVAHPTVIVELGNETFEATTTELTGDERDQMYSRQIARHPRFAEYQVKTSRQIPVIALERQTNDN